MAKPAISFIAVHAASFIQDFNFEELEAEAVGFANDFGEGGVRHFAFVVSHCGRHGAVFRTREAGTMTIERIGVVGAGGGILLHVDKHAWLTYWIITMTTGILLMVWEMEVL